MPLTKMHAPERLCWRDIAGELAARRDDYIFRPLTLSNMRGYDGEYVTPCRYNGQMRRYHYYRCRARFCAAEAGQEDALP